MTKPHIGFQIPGSEEMFGELNSIVPDFGSGRAISHRMNEMTHVFELPARANMGIISGFAMDLIQPTVIGPAVDDTEYSSLLAGPTMVSRSRSPIRSTWSTIAGRYQ